jgi:hypothetical protein
MNGPPGSWPKTNSPLTIIGFHTQQAVDKYLKAVLSYRQIEYPRTHDIDGILALLETRGIPIPEDADDLVALTPYGVVGRYEDPIPPTEAAWVASVASFAVLLKNTRTWAESFIPPDPDEPTAVPQP